MTKNDLVKIMKVGIQLSSERDINLLLENILICAMEVAHCDAGTLYLLEDHALHFKIMRNDTLKSYSGGNGTDPDLPPVPLLRENVCALAFLEDRIIRIADVYTSTEADFSGPVLYDGITGYHTQSMLVVPMKNREGEKIGVIQLINAFDKNGKIIEFREELILMLEWVASQSAISIQNALYVREIKGLINSLVSVMSSAVDERTPYNASHTRHMVEYGERFLDYLNRQAEASGEKPPYPEELREELLMGVWFHDIGKLTTPLEVMNKETRLLPEQHACFLHRMEIIRLHGQIRRLSGQITPEELEAITEKTKWTEEFVDQINGLGFLPDDKKAALDDLSTWTYTDSNGKDHPWITLEEYTMLSIRRGTLSSSERVIMEDHVIVTDKLLSQIHFPNDLSHVREWASSHHEFLDGSGYPNHLKGDELPKEVRIITILDIFDALTADDRPYKPGIPVEKALSVLDAMANREGKLDAELTRQFIESRCWES